MNFSHSGLNLTFDSQSIVSLKKASLFDPLSKLFVVTELKGDHASIFQQYVLVFKVMRSNSDVSFYFN